MSVDVEMRGALSVVTIRGESERNLVTPALVLDLDAALRRFESDSTAAVAVLVGGERHFWGGSSPEESAAVFADMTDVKGKLRHYTYPMAQEPRGFAVAWLRLLRWRTSKPVIAAVEGDCFDLGLVLLGVHTDLRIAGVSARFGLPAIRRGDAPGAALVSRLADQIAPVWLQWMVETAEPIDADTAYRAHLVNEIVPEGQAAARATAVAERVAGIPAAILRAEKTSVQLARRLPDDDALVVAAAFAKLAESGGD